MTEFLRHPWHTVQSPEQLEQFLQTHFDVTSRYYRDEVQRNLTAHPHRLANPLYLPFVARSEMIITEYQFPEALAHIGWNKHHGWKWDFMAPVSLLALDIFLARSVIPHIQQKANLLENWRQNGQITRENVTNLLATWVPPHTDFPNAEELEELSWKNIKINRLDKNLPVFIPDTRFLANVASIPMEENAVGTLTKNQFAREVLPSVQEVFFVEADVQMAAELFLNDQEPW